MRKTLLTILTTGTMLAAFSQTPAASISIIPTPVSITQGQGYFTLPATISIETRDQQSLQQAITDLESHLHNATGRTTVIAKPGAAATIHLTLNKTPDATLGDEGYDLSVTTTGIRIKANKPAGIFYGTQTLLQLFPKEIESRTPAKSVAWQLPIVAIRDYPRFGWRGLMLDVSRHFFTKQEVKDFIDEMVKYKYNLLHWHLTDDQGWRIEIKALPKLTEVGAWNVKREGRFGTFSEPA
ncbi:MAG TPA: family 20 glycosylhydrolase, partial [Puia sp.]|nr:family 20 glycosylhydrolase [Puia sp.]